MIWIFLIPAGLVLFTFLYLKLNPQFGGTMSKKAVNSYKKSTFWKKNKFENREVTTMDISLRTLPGLLKEQFTDTKKRTPERKIPIIPFDKNTFSPADGKPKFVWYGHSVLLLQIAGKNLLIDPMLGPDAAPIVPFPSRRYSENSLKVIDSLPALDAILITHDHYDHLDFASIKKLKNKTENWFTALGVGRHLERWGIPGEKIQEFDWWDDLDFQGIKMTFTPSRHFSGRGMFDRAKSLWGGWVFQTPEHQIYWSGDGGYGPHFKEIGEKFGPFDWAFMECGQYDERWRQIHMMPEEAVLAAKEVGAKEAIAVHWGGFTLALHAWKEPAERFTAEAERTELPLCLPRIGETVVLGEAKKEAWWTELE